MAQSKAKLIYVGDPMCSWCYGFSPELTKTLDQVGDELELQLIMGGLRPYNTETMSDLADFLKEHWEHVHEASGQAFSYDILKSSTITYDTEPPSRAVLVVRQLQPAAELSFFKAVQKAFYVDNKNMHLAESYFPILKTLGIDTERFQTAFHSDEMKAAVRKDFELAVQLGVRGFPSIVLQKGDQYFLIANGYMKSEQLVKQIRSKLK